MNAFGWIGYWLLSSNLMIIGVGLIRHFYKDKIGSKWLNVLWAIVLIRLLCPILPSRNFNIISKINPIWRVNHIVQVATNNRKKIDQINYDVEEYPILGKENNVFGTWGQENNQQVITRLIVIGIGGSFFVGIYFIYANRRLRERLEKCPLIEETEIISCMEKIKEELGIKGEIQLIEGPSPMLVGILNPVIVIPVNYSIEEIKLMLVHECMHYKRCDQLFNLLQLMALSIHWYNPLVWLMTKWTKADRELACDANVLARGRSKKQYAQLLVEMASQKDGSIYLVQGMKHEGKNLEQRIKALYTKGKRNKKETIILAVIVGGMLILGLTNPGKEKGNLKENQWVNTINSDEMITLETGEEKKLIIDIPELKKGENQCIGPFTLEAGSRWNVSLDWEGEGVMYALCQQKLEPLFSDCQCIIKDGAIEEAFTVDKAGEYYFFIGYKNSIVPFDAMLKEIKGEIVIKK